MRKRTIAFGFCIGIVGIFLGVLLFDFGVGIYKGLSFSQILDRSFSSILLEKRISIGALLNLPIFYFFLNKRKDNHAKGVLLATVLLAVVILINKL